MDKFYPLTVLCLAALWCGVSPAFAVAPSQVNYQGLLTDSTGAPLSGPYSMTFTIYDAPSDPANVLWAETLTVVELSNGLFDVLLGSVNRLSDGIFSDTGRYLGIKVGTDPEIEPRTSLATTPYAFRVQTVDGATGGNIYGDLNLHSTLTVGDPVSPPGLPGVIEVTSGILSTVLIYGNVGGAGAMVVTGSDGAATIGLDGQYGHVFIAKSGAGGRMYLHGGGDSGSYIDMYNPSDFNTAKILSTEDGDDGAKIELYQANQEEGVVIDGDDAGGENGGGSIFLYNSGGYRTVKIDGDEADDASAIYLRDAIGNNRLWLDPDASGDYGAQIVMLEAGIQTAEILGSETGTDGGRVTLCQADGEKGIIMDAEDTAGGYGGGGIYVFNDFGDTTVEIDGSETADDASAVRLWDNANHATIKLDAQAPSYGGAQVLLKGYDGNITFNLVAEDGAGGGGNIWMYDDAGTNTARIDASSATYGGGQLQLKEDDGTTTVYLEAAGGAEGGANVSLKTGAGVQTIRLDADYAGTGEGRVITNVLEITGGADLSEQFDITYCSTKPSPGMVVCIDPIHPGKLVVSSKACDPTVAGVISGANGIKSGMLMSQAGSVSDGLYAVALTGRVYCQVDASYGSVNPGDLLTTSNTPGHAMKVTDYSQSQGAIIGKAMSSLQESQGLVLVLVSLQ